jgi:aspartate/methionine/tyrosine aminotransferase
MKPTNSYFNNIPTTIFTVMTKLALEHDSINLGQGFPDKDGPDWMKDVAAQAITNGYNQYPPMQGIPELCQAVSTANKNLYNLDICSKTEVLITSGATEALAASLLGLLESGDEAIVIEPFYDAYIPQIIAAGATPRYLRLSAPDWTLNEKNLEDVFSDKTKVIILNSPMNPCAKVFKEEELTLLATYLKKFDAYAVCDEVYENLIFDQKAHIPLMSIDGMRNRCVRIGSAGKSFSFTGWKIGYVSASKELLKPIQGAHQFITFTVPPALQIAVAEGLNRGDEIYSQLISEMNVGRSILREGLNKIGFNVLPCEGTYFLIADYSKLSPAVDDVEFCKTLTSQAKVTAIPLSPFYSSDNGKPPMNMIRFCFAKQEEKLNRAILNLEEFFNNNKTQTVTR